MLIEKNPMERYRAVLETQRINWDSFEFKSQAIDETKVNMINILFNIFSNSYLNSICLKYFKDESGGWGRTHLQLHKGLKWENTYWKLAMHANCFDKIQKSMIHDLGSRHNGGSNRFDRLKSCCHHSLRDLCVHTDGAWWKLKKYCH